MCTPCSVKLNYSVNVITFVDEQNYQVIRFNKTKSFKKVVEPVQLVNIGLLEPCINRPLHGR